MRARPVLPNRRFEWRRDNPLARDPYLELGDTTTVGHNYRTPYPDFL